MRLIPLDFETYYDNTYSLSKMTTEAYVRDPRFETIMVSLQNGDNIPCYAIGHNAVQVLLDSLDIENNAVLCHHAHFDGLILSHHFGHRPKVWFDTLSMARALHGIEVGGSLAKLSEHYGVGRKGGYVKDALGKRLADFTAGELQSYGLYSMNDLECTRGIFDKMLPGFPKKELKIIDMVIRMFTEPELVLNEDGLREYALTLAAEKATLLFEAGVTKDEVMSNERFAAALQRAGIDPPKKISARTGQLAWAFSKTDKEFMALQEHESDQVQALMAARLGNKTTLNETRALKMADMAARGPACIYYKYSGAAQTHRLSGGDGMNWQNLTRGGTLRDCIEAPEGKMLVVPDSSNIEARVLDWLAMQDDAVQVYRDYDAGLGPDVYCVMATKLYGRDITPDDKQERQLGKVAKLQLGFQSGAERFRESARIMGGITIDMATAATVVDVYRQTHGMVKVLWNRAQNALGAILSGDDEDKYVDPRGIVAIERGALLLPNGLRIRYPELRFEKHERGGEWRYRSQRGETSKIYGGKVVENIVQALARIIVMEQTLEISRRFSVKMSTHDEGVFCVEEDRAEELRDVAKAVMSEPLPWCRDLPLASKVGIAKRYGDAK